MENYATYETKIGTVWICADEQGITNIALHGQNLEKCRKYLETDLIHAASSQLKEYLDGKRKIFSLPLSLKGTVFQCRVWEALCQIPYGETRSYSQIAKQIGNPKACRAVGMANHRNPILIVVPCHRVIGADGSLTGYGSGLKLKQTLLDLERGAYE